jgi:hypothetical protein
MITNPGTEELLTTGVLEAAELDAPTVPAGAWFNAMYP